MYHSVKSTFNPAVLNNFSMIVFNDSDGLSRSNLTVTFARDLANTVGSFAITLKNMDNETINFPNILKGNFDACKIQKGQIGHFVVKMIKDKIQDFSNYSFECPQMKGKYYADNFPIMGMEYLPYFPRSLLGARLNFEFVAVAKAKILKAKSLTFMLKMHLHGSATF